jgi:hypothetical protein
MVFGYKAMQDMTFHTSSGAGAEESMNSYVANNHFISSNPQKGDEIFILNTITRTVKHTGLVYDVDSQYVYTIEGNTSGKYAGNVCVAKNKYALNSGKIKGYGRPDWSKAPNTFYYTGGGISGIGTDYINAYITYCTKTNLGVNVSSFSTINQSSITGTLYKGEVTVSSTPEDTDEEQGTNEIEKNKYDVESELKIKGLYDSGKLAKLDIDISELPPNELATLELSVSNGSGASKIGLGFTTAQAYPKHVSNVQITAMRYSYDTVFDTTYNVYFSRLSGSTLNGSESDWGYWKDKKNWTCGYSVYLLKDRKIYHELFNFTDSTTRLPTNLRYSSGNFYFDLNKVLLDVLKIKDLRELGLGSNIQIGVRTWIRGKYTNKDKKEVTLSLPELPRCSNTLHLDYKTNVTNRCYFNLDGKYARLSIHKNTSK